MSTKYIYFFGGGDAEGRGDQKELLGGKGAGLAEMSSLGLPVPPGFTLTTEACRRYLAPLIVGEAYPPYANGLPCYVRLKNVGVEKKLATGFDLKL